LRRGLGCARLRSLGLLRWALHLRALGLLRRAWRGAPHAAFGSAGIPLLRFTREGAGGKGGNPDRHGQRRDPRIVQEFCN